MSYSEALEALVREQRKWSPGVAYREPDQLGLVAAHMPRPEQARLFMAAHLAYADPYYVAPDICGLLGTSCVDLPDGKLDGGMIPGRSGWLWFARPLAVPGLGVVRTLTCVNEKIRALSWAVVQRETDGRAYWQISGPPEPGAILHGISLMVYFDCDEGHGVDLVGIDSWPHAEKISDAAPADPTARASEAMTGAEEVAPFARRLFFAFCAFVAQRILITPRHRAERHARKRLEREGYAHEPLVRVVELRRKQSRPTHGDAEHEAIEWSCQWVVSGHWRNQWHPSLNDYQPRWIMPYVKGDPAKPLKPPRAKVFAVIR